jgi:hypothetical protein
MAAIFGESHGILGESPLSMAGALWELRPYFRQVAGGTMLSEVPRMLKRWWLGTANARIRSNLHADAVRGILSRPLAELHGIPIGDLMARTPTLCASSSSRPETRSSSPSPLSSPYLQSTGPRHRGIFKH